ncbi:hypothetical protein AWZ03_012213 [Drosophila navojoa]|uniref:Uncharacterized protein n=1 Tax=Drosophila navojoa TaxID=7232 RepID=A0A484AXP3_DRONA|nr:hypothetical protein AWZ03_012213 [Drosophila navojoa]
MAYVLESMDEEEMILDIESGSSSDEDVMDTGEQPQQQQQQQGEPLELDLESDVDESDKMDDTADIGSEDVDITSDEDDLIEYLPEYPTMHDIYESVEMGLAGLDGSTEVGVFDEQAQAEQLEQIKQIALQQLMGEPSTSNQWAVIAPLHTSSVVNVMRLCFGRIDRNEYRIYEAIYRKGYYPLPGPPLKIDGLTMQPSGQLEPLIEGLPLTDTYVHLFPYSALGEDVKQTVLEETGADIPELLNKVDTEMGIELVPDAELNIMCVGRSDRVGIHFRSCTQPHEQQLQKEPHSGINIFGEPTVVTMIIAQTEVVLTNEQILELVNNPDSKIYLYIDSTSIYVLNGRVLFENSELGQHILPIKNVDFIPFSQSEPISMDSDSEDL